MWGASTAAYQIEGAWNEDGKGEGIWDRFCRRPYAIRNGDSGEVSCDHYHHMPDDVTLMKKLGLKSYRFSISWPRVIPTGSGALNPKGMDFYDQLVDRLLAAGISPNATLYHWDLPQKIHELGGWLNRDSAEWFADFAHIVFNRLGDRVALWSTHNEPWATAFQGYGHGAHAPGMMNYSKAYQVTHHLLLSHGKAVQVFRQGGYSGQIGIVLSLAPRIPASNTEADKDACQRMDENNSRLYSDPIFLGYYPRMLMEWIGTHAPKVQPGDMQIINQPIDFLGVNYYVTESVSYSHRGGLLRCGGQFISAPGWGTNELGWGVYPAGLTRLLLELKQAYGNPVIYITENGCAHNESADENGYVEDWWRVDYLRAHLRAAHEAIQLGVNLKGYYVWSLMDNFEWNHGFTPRFGLVRIDYSNRRRIPKRSATWYHDVIENNGLEA